MTEAAMGSSSLKTYASEKMVGLPSRKHDVERQDAS